MHLGSPYRTRGTLAWPALLATVFLLIVLLGLYTLMESRRLERNLRREVQERAVALIGVLEASSKNAIASNALLEEAVAQRLLDNARFIDFVVGRSPRAQDLIQRVVAGNKLAKVELLDPQGSPIDLQRVLASSPGPRGGQGAWSRPPVPPPLEEPGEPPEQAPPGRSRSDMMAAMMRQMMRPPGEAPSQTPPSQRMPGMPFMWGWRWGNPRGDPAALFPSLPKPVKIRRFWEGSAFGVAVPAQSFHGIIAVHADAEYLLNFRREIGVEHLIQDLGRQSGVAAVSLLDKDLTVLASSDPARVGRREDNPFLQEAWRAGAVSARRLKSPDGREVYAVVKPFTLETKQAGLVQLDLSTEGLAGVARQAQRGILFYSLGLLVVGIAGAVAIFWAQARHLAERRLLEEAMAHEQRLSAVGNLAAGVAHEVRNPLNAISIGLQRLRKEFAPADMEARAEYTRFTEIMQAEIGRLNDIVSRFLTLARPSRLILSDEPLAPLLEEVMTLLAAQASGQKIRTEVDLRLGAARVRMDRQKLAHAFMNVLLNAIQAMPEGGTLTVRAESGSASTGGGGAAGRGVQVRIADSGPGIAPENLDRIFEPYFTTKEGGTGLGLALAHKIIQEHQGTIRAESQPGAGATLMITLPVAEAGKA